MADAAEGATDPKTKFELKYIIASMERPVLAGGAC
jgi:hypothetical protein